MGDDQYYLNINKQNHGPFSEEKVREMLSSGQISFKTPIWKQGLPQWICVGDLDEFSNRQQPAAPVAVPEAPRTTETEGNEVFEWFLFEREQQIGPLSREEIISKIEGKKLRKTTYAWKEGMSEWTQLMLLDEFRNLFDTETLPPPTSSLQPSQEEFSEPARAEKKKGKKNEPADLRLKGPVPQQSVMQKKALKKQKRRKLMLLFLLLVLSVFLFLNYETVMKNIDDLMVAQQEEVVFKEPDPTIKPKVKRPLKDYVCSCSYAKRAPKTPGGKGFKDSREKATTKAEAAAQAKISTGKWCGQVKDCLNIQKCWCNVAKHQTKQSPAKSRKSKRRRRGR